MAKENYLQTLSSFSGADLLVTFGNRHIGELQSISWAIQREKAPIYTLGAPDPRSFSRGKRGIAGSLIFAVFDRDALMEEMMAAWETIAPARIFTAAGNVINRRTADFNNAISLINWNDRANQAAANRTPDQLTTIPAGFQALGKEQILYLDTLPPFKQVA